MAVLPTLRRNLVTRGVEDELLGLFKGIHRYTWARSQRLIGAALPLIARLQEAGISTMLLKGAAFIAQGRFDAGERAIADIDVLVPTERLADAVAVLQDSGFRPMDGRAGWYVTQYAPRYSPSYGFADPEQRQVDLHWHVLHGSRQPDADDDFWDAALPAELLGVPVRVLSATDELLHVIAHGLRWNAVPTYRWVLDAAILTSRGLDPIDYQRLADQAVKRRLSLQLLAGLSYLQDKLQVPIPAEVLGQLRAAASRIERLELRAQMKQPRQRRWFEQLLLYHEQHLRRDLPLGTRPGIARRLRLERRRLGLRTPLDLRHVRDGGRPGPGRPTADGAAAVGDGKLPRSPSLDATGTLSFADPSAVRHHILHGIWPPEEHGAWIAGREARLIIELPKSLNTKAALSITADTHVSDQELTVIANGIVAGRLPLAHGAALREALVFPDARACAGKSSLDLRLRCRRAASIATLGSGDDDRLLAVFLRRLELIAPGPYVMGRRLALAGPAEAATMSASGCLFLSGWHEPEREGRWTDSVARLYLHVTEPARVVDLEFEARPYLGRRGDPLRFTISAGRQRLGRLSWDSPDRRRTRLPIPREAFEPDGGLTLTWRVSDPRSPQAEGESTDARTLGLMVESLALVDR